MPTGKMLHLPESGPVMEQNELLLSSMYFAWRAWHIHEYKTANQHTQDDVDWTREWIFGDEE